MDDDMICRTTALTVVSFFRAMPLRPRSWHLQQTQAPEVTELHSGLWPLSSRLCSQNFWSQCSLVLAASNRIERASARIKFFKGHPLKRAVAGKRSRGQMGFVCLQLKAETPVHSVALFVARTKKQKPKFACRTYIGRCVILMREPLCPVASWNRTPHR